MMKMVNQMRLSALTISKFKVVFTISETQWMSLGETLRRETMGRKGRRKIREMQMENEKEREETNGENGGKRKDPHIFCISCTALHVAGSFYECPSNGFAGSVSGRIWSLRVRKLFTGSTYTSSVVWCMCLEATATKKRLWLVSNWVSTRSRYSFAVQVSRATENQRLQRVIPTCLCVWPRGNDTDY